MVKGVLKRSVKPILKELLYEMMEIEDIDIKSLKLAHLESNKLSGTGRIVRNELKYAPRYVVLYKFIDNEGETLEGQLRFENFNKLASYINRDELHIFASELKATAYSSLSIGQFWDYKGFSSSNFIRFYDVSGNNLYSIENLDKIKEWLDIILDEYPELGII